MRKYNLHKSVLALLVLFFFTGCRLSKYQSGHSDPLKSKRKIFDEYVLVENKVKLEKQKYKIKEDKDLLIDGLSTTIKQSTSSSLLRPLLTWLAIKSDTLVYRYTFDKSLGEFKKDSLRRRPSKFMKYLGPRFGQPLLILDEEKAASTAETMRRYLVRKSYFNATVKYTVKRNKRKGKAIVKYHVKTGMPLLIDSVQFHSSDTNILKILQATSQASLLQKKTTLSDKVLLGEKRRVLNLLLDRGYYTLSPQFIKIQADTTNAKKFLVKKGLFIKNEQGEPRVNVYLDIKPPANETLHESYSLRNVYIIPNELILKPHQKRKIEKDSIFVIQRKVGKNKKRIKTLFFKEQDSIRVDDRHIQTILLKKYSKDIIIRNSIISAAVLIHKGDLYQKKLKEKTIEQVTKLSVFRFPKIDFIPVIVGDSTYLDCYVRMQLVKKINWGGDFDFNNSSSSTNSIGLMAGGNIQNRNVFKGGEIFSFNVNGGVDVNLDGGNLTGGNTGSNIIEKWINLLDINAETGLALPRYLGLFSGREWLKMQDARTKFSLGYRYLQRASDFRISSFYANMGYDWQLKGKHFFVFNPAVLNFTLEPILADSFRSDLQKSNIALLNSLSAKYLIPSANFTYSYNNTRTTSKHNFSFKGFVEIAGNLLYFIDNIFDQSKSLQVFGVDYAQYTKVDFDLRYAYGFNKRQTIAFRLNTGAIFPYGNTADKEIPFVSQFALGGPSSMRAWNFQHLGPGRTLVDQDAAFQLGDIRGEFNIEFRQKLNSWIGLGFFTDIGNIWLMRTPDIGASILLNQPDGRISWDFYKELAVGAGLGVRFDLSFVIMRLDFAVQMRAPQGFGAPKADGTQAYWNLEPFRLKGRNKWVLGIGYPF